MDKLLIFISKLPIHNDFKQAMDDFRKIIDYISKNNAEISEDEIDLLFSNSKLLDNILKILVNSTNKKEIHEFSNYCYANSYVESLLIGYVKKHNLDIDEILEDGEIKRKKIMSNEETNKYIDLWQKEHDYNARNILLDANDGLVKKIVNEYSSAINYDDFDDMLQEGRIGLMKAIDKYNHTYGYRFSTYAWHWIRQAVTRALADQTRTIRIPVNQVEKICRIRKAAIELEKDLGRRPSINEISKIVGIKPADIEYLFSLNSRLVSLDQKIKDESDSKTLIDFISLDKSLEEETLKEISKTELLSTMYETLTPREAKILSLRWGLNDSRAHSLQEIGDMYGLTRQRINQIENSAIKKLKSPAVIKRLKSVANNSSNSLHPTLLDVFKNYNEHILKQAIDKLPLYYQRIIFKRYGKTLVEYYSISIDELQLLYQEIFNELEIILKRDNVIKPVSFMGNFIDEPIDNVLDVVSTLGPRSKSILRKAYGNNLDECNAIERKDYYKLLALIRNIKIQVFTNDVKKNIHSIYDLFPEYDREVVLNAIESPDIAINVRVLFSVFGKNLDELLKVTPLDYMYVINHIKPTILDVIKNKGKELQYKKDVPKSLFLLTNISRERVLSGIEDYLNENEKELLYKYYGYDLDNPQYMLLTNNFKSYVESMIFYKLFDNVRENRVIKEHDHKYVKVKK